MRRVFARPLVRVLMLGLAAGAMAGASKNTPPATRVVFVEETLRLSLPSASGAVRVWMPRPADNAFQSAELVTVDSPWPYRVTREREFDNAFLYMEAAEPPAGPVELRVRYRVRRREQREADRSRGPSPLDRQPRGLVAVDEKIRRLAAEQTRGLADPLEKARALYRYVLGRMVYDKSGTGWGRGDSIYACEVGKGNCTDFHSLFMALALASEIPVRFQMGYPPLPAAAEGDVSRGYHCWAEFFAPGRGWVPVDISEAWKNPARADYYFGALDPDRVLVSSGREIRLSPPQAGPPLNFLYRPYVEVDGKPFDGFKLNRYFRNASSTKGEKKT